MADPSLQTTTQSERRISCADGVELRGTCVRAAQPDHAVLISSGTGFPQGYYLALASYLAARGAVALTYDYRGIGRSATLSTLREADLPDWGTLDLAACIDCLSAEAKGLPLLHIGHSVGGHLAGFAANSPFIHRHAFVAVGSGTWWRHPARQWPLELYFWWGIGAINLTRSGYIKPGLGWTGEALPGPMFRTWRRWSHRQRYHRDFIEGGPYAQRFAAIKAPIRSWVFTDDGIANPTTAQDILACYPNAPRSIALTRPEAFGLRRIGHEGAFKDRCAPLWDQWRSWLLEGL